MKIVETILQSDREDDVASRVLGFNAGTLKVEKLLPCDVEHDTMADVPEEKRADKRYSRHGDFSIQGLIEGVKAVSPSLDCDLGSGSLERLFFRIFPESVCGSSVTKTTSRGTMKFSRRF